MNNTVVALLSIFVISSAAHAQTNISNQTSRNAPDTLTHSDTLTASHDTLQQKVDTFSLKFSDSEIKSPINYQAEDSIVYDLETRKMYLYNKADLKYDKITLAADSVEFDWNTYTLAAGGRKNDSTGEISGKPVFSESGKEYNAGRMAYNFKTKKGKIFDVVTQEGEAYIHSEAVKRNEFEEWYSLRAKYTTCNLDHPHFYFQAKKVKVVPNKVLVTGPANLVVGDVPTPIFIPFGIFPAKQGRRSGLIIPKPGRDNSYGFFLREGGFFWAVNDYFNLKFTGDVFTNGTFGVNVGSEYRVNYKANGNIGFTYYRTQPADVQKPVMLFQCSGITHKIQRVFPTLIFL
ncbi:MAG TPA: putative LPS assembly protein LptD [Chitinophagales bacterium]|nr:putative LPS assembly protein LptD [Chitinophagales bacterium]